MSNTPATGRRWLRFAAAALLPMLALPGARAVTYYQTTNHNGSGSWDIPSHWNTNPDPSKGTYATAITSADDFISSRSGGGELRTPSVTSTFGGGSLTMGGTQVLNVKGGGSNVMTIPNLITRSSPRFGGGSNQSNLVITQFRNNSESTEIKNNSATNAWFNVTIGTLTGSGNLNATGPATGTVKLTITDATSYLGTLTVSSGKFEFTNAVSSGGAFVATTPGNITLNHNVTFTGLTVNGVAYNPGTYTGSSLGFVGNPASTVTVRVPTTWYLTTSQTSGQDWTHAYSSQWRINANGSGASAPSMNLVDTYIHNVGSNVLRTPTTSSTFLGGSLTLGGNAQLVLAGGGSAISTVPVLNSTGGVINAGSSTRNLAVDTYTAVSGSTTLSGSSGGVLNLFAGELKGSGNFTVSGAGQFRPFIDEGNGYTGTFTVNSGATLNVQTKFGTAGKLVVNSGGLVVLNDWVYVTGLTVAGSAKPVGTYTAANLGSGFSGSGRIVVYTRDLDGPPQMFGVNLAGGEFDGGPYWQTNPQVWDYYKNKGLTLIRLPFDWERVQSSLNGTVNFTKLDECVALARQRGMKVILDMHSYNKYNGVQIGTGAVTYAAFANVWSQFAEHYKGDEAIYGYDLMNEPGGTLENWAAAAQTAVDAIRKHDQTAYVIVEGMSHSSASNWVSASGALDIKDPVGRLIYSAHTYWDSIQSTLPDGKQNWASDGIYVNNEPRAPDRGVLKAQPFVEWLQTRPYAHGNFGEYGIPNNYNSADWNIVLDNFLAYLRANNISGTYWAGGTHWGNYQLSCHPASLTSGPDKAQMAVLQLYNNHHLNPGGGGGGPLTIVGVSATAQQSGNEAHKSYDGDHATRWSAEGTQSIQWDLGSAQSVGGVKLAFLNLRQYSFKIDVSTDGSTWTSALATQSSSGATEQFETFAFSAPVNARYVRYTGYGSNANAWNNIREVEITGDSGAPSGAPLTITGVSASAQQSGNEAFKTYDGNLGTRWAAEGTQSIQWDLGSAQSVTAFKAAFHQLRHYSFQIDASANGTTWTSVLSGQTSSGATETLETFAFTAPVNARYIRYTGYGSNANAWNSLKEIELIGP